MRIVTGGEERGGEKEFVSIRGEGTASVCRCVFVGVKCWCPNEVGALK